MIPHSRVLAGPCVVLYHFSLAILSPFLNFTNLVVIPLINKHNYHSIVIHSLKITLEDLNYPLPQFSHSFTNLAAHPFTCVTFIPLQSTPSQEPTLPCLDYPLRSSLSLQFSNPFTNLAVLPFMYTTFIPSQSTVSRSHTQGLGCPLRGY